MSEAMRAEEMQTGGEANAQNPSPEEMQLQSPAPDAGVSPGEGTGGPAGDGAAEGAPSDEGAVGSKPPSAPDAQASAQEPEAGAAPAGGSDARKGDASGAEARAAAATARLADALVSTALQNAGVPAARAAWAAKLMDVSQIDPLADDAAQQYADAARKLVSDIPEFVPAAGGTGSAGEHPRRAASPDDETAAAFRRGMGR